MRTFSVRLWILHHDEKINGACFADAPLNSTTFDGNILGDSILLQYEHAVRNETTRRALPTASTFDVGRRISDVIWVGNRI